MIESCVAWSVKNYRRVLLIVLLTTLCSLFVAWHLRFDALPDVTGQQVAVITRAPGRTPEEVELLITKPLEMALGGIQGLSGNRSISLYGLSSITLLFQDNVDLLRARQLVQERIQTAIANIPRDVGTPELGPLSGGLGEIYQFAVSSPERTAAQLLEIVQYNMAPILRAVPGIVEVNPWGGEQRTMDVIGDPVDMARHRITLRELTEATRQTSGQVAGATLERGSAGMLLRGVAWPRHAGDLAASVIRIDDHGDVIRIGDVAHVVEGALPRIGAATINGQGETVYVMLQMQLGANARDVLKDVHQAMTLLKKHLPSDVVIQEVYDRSRLVQATLKTVFMNLLEGGLLVIFVLFAMLGSFRAGLLVASVIPLSMLGAMAGMALLHIPGNLMSLGALDFGLLVDGAVVMIEALFFAIHMRGGDIAAHIRETSVRMAKSVFFAVVIIMLVYLPILTLSGVEGKLFRPMAISVLLALASALLLSLFYIPAAAHMFLRARDVPAHDPPLVAWFAKCYAPLLAQAMAKPQRVFGIAAGMLAVGLLLFALIGTSFVPQLGEGDLVVQTTRDPDIRIETAIATNLTMEKAIRASVPEVAQIASRLGSPAIATDVMSISQADVFIQLHPTSEWRDGMSRDDVIAEVNKAIQASTPVQEIAFTQPIQMRFNELVGGSVADVTVSLYAESFDTLQTMGAQVATLLKTVDGADDVRIFAPPSVSLVEVRPKPIEAARLGLSPDDILQHVSALRAGIHAGITYDGPVQIPLRVLLGSSTDALTLERTPIPTRDGHAVQLTQVASVERTEGPALINHEMGDRRIVVGFNVRDRDLGSVVKDGRALIEAQGNIPNAVRMVWGGQYESFQSARKRLAWIIPTVLTAIFLLLLLLFRDHIAALLILLNVPFSAVGGILTLFSRNLPLSISAAIGFIALSGIAVMNGVVLMGAFQDSMAAGENSFDAARHAAISRLRPVLMTALVAALGFVPMMLATGTGAEVQRPLATVVVGGLITSTFLTLIILPVLLARVYRTAPSTPLP